MKKIKIVFALILMILCVFLFAQEKDNAQNSQSYHGMRVSSDQSAFEIVFVSTENGIIQLGFSLPVNPNSFKPENILLNGKALTKETPIKFNKTGKLVEITMPLPASAESNLVLKDIVSFDNQTLASTELTGLKPGEIKHYSVK